MTMLSAFPAAAPATQVSMPVPLFGNGDPTMTKLEAWLLAHEGKTFNAYYNGKMSYALHGSKWAEYVAEAMPNLKEQQTSENIYKAVIDLYAENLVPMPEELRGFSNVLVPLLSRGECPVVVDSAGTPHFPEHYEMMSDGTFTIAAIFTRNLEKMKDYLTFAYTNGTTRVFQRGVPEDFSAAGRDVDGYTFVDEETGSTLFRFALDDKGFGASMAALQDRVNHSVIDQTIVAEMYARPFWYLLKADIAPVNPYLPTVQPDLDGMTERKVSGKDGPRIFTTSAEGPFGQLQPPTISDMISYHDSIIDKVSQSSGIPQYYFKPGTGTPPTGVALKVLSKRFNNKIARMRDDLNPVMEELAALLGVKKKAVKKDTDGKDIMEYELWNTSDDLLQESLDAHGVSLIQMGYPLEYVAEVVTPGVNLEDYMDDALADGDQQDPFQGDPAAPAPGQPVATPGQVQAYAQNPGQKAKPGAR